jgi:hypothetical protein
MSYINHLRYTKKQGANLEEELLLEELDDELDDDELEDDELDDDELDDDELDEDLYTSTFLLPIYMNM